MASLFADPRVTSHVPEERVSRTARLRIAHLVLAGGLVAIALAGCGGGSDQSADVEAAAQKQYPNRGVTCAKSDVTYGGGHAYSCRLGGKPLCLALVDGELLPLWDERPLRPGEPGYSDEFGATVRTGPSC
jgi:hypothetical protein